MNNKKCLVEEIKNYKMYKSLLRQLDCEIENRKSLLGFKSITFSNENKGSKSNKSEVDFLLDVERRTIERHKIQEKILLVENVISSLSELDQKIIKLRLIQKDTIRVIASKVDYSTAQIDRRINKIIIEINNYEKMIEW